MKTIFVTYAVQEEFVEIEAKNYKIVYIQTGIGKTKSAYHLTKRILTEKPDFVLNIGTAGTIQHQIGDVFIVKHFIDRDYSTLELPVSEFEIEGKLLIKDYPQLHKLISAYPKVGVCSTGDTFVEEISTLPCDFVDMEAHAQAYVCKELDIPFLSIKYITDIVGQNSIKLWESKLSDARKTLTEWFITHDLLSLIANNQADEVYAIGLK